MGSNAVLKLFDQFDRIEKVASPAFKKAMSEDDINNVFQKFIVGDRVRILEMIPFDEFSRDKLRGTVIGVDPTPGGWLYGVRRDSGEFKHAQANELVKTEG